jgi:tetratricopeptide (TPR) repeat protein
MIPKQSEFYDQLISADEKKLLGLHDEAIEICEAILLEDLECTEAYEELGDNYLSLREYDKAIRALTKSLELDPFSTNARYLLGFVYSAMSRWDESVEELELADQMEPNHAEILRCLGWSVYHSGKKVQGLALLERASNLASDDVLILCDLGVCFLNSRDFTQAAEVFNNVLSLDPGNTKALECLQACEYFESKLS